MGFSNLLNAPHAFSVPLVFMSSIEDNSRIPAQIAGVWCVSREVVDEDTPEGERAGVRRRCAGGMGGEKGVFKSCPTSGSASDAFFSLTEAFTASPALSHLSECLYQTQRTAPLWRAPCSS